MSPEQQPDAEHTKKRTPPSRKGTHHEPKTKTQIGKSVRETRERYPILPMSAFTEETQEWLKKSKIDLEKQRQQEREQLREQRER